MTTPDCLCGVTECSTVKLTLCEYDALLKIANAATDFCENGRDAYDDLVEAILEGQDFLTQHPERRGIR